MFYSDVLLSKTGPLARVWLSANLERKLSKTHILQSNIQNSVEEIVKHDQAPMALRLSGQLLLGVVRIYSRKTRYLLEDCNESLMKIKMAFRPGNVDLPAGAISHTSAQLTLPDAITEMDLLLPDPTLEFDLGNLLDDLPAQPGHQRKNADITLDSGSFISSMGQARAYDQEEDLQLEEDLLDIDIGEDRDIGVENLLGGSDSMEIGRDAPLARDIAEDLFDQSRMSLDLGLDTPKRQLSVAPALEEELDLGLDDPMDFGRGGMDIDFEGDTTVQPPAEVTPVPEAQKTIEPTPAPSEVVQEPEAEVAAATPKPAAREASPASTARPNESRQATVEPVGEPNDTTFQMDAEDLRMPSEEVETAHARAPNPRKRKLIIDAITNLKTSDIRQQQEDRSNIVKQPTFMPRDPTLLALVSLAKTGGLARSVFFPKNIAPELANLLSPAFVKQQADLKRKREAVAGVEEEVEGKRPSPPKVARLELDAEEEMEEEQPLEFQQEEEIQDEMMELPQDLEIPMMPVEVDESFAPRREATASPVPEILPQGEITAEEYASLDLPPAQEEVDVPHVISRETRHAVHILREQFTEPKSGSKKSDKKTVHFHQLLPPKQTTKSDATKMFFEVLVLATKDAVEVHQAKGFGDIEIRQKKGLWGAWAEEKDSQQVADEEEQARDEEEGGERRQLNLAVGTGRA
ncbi:Rec8 like protein-domain-containing protein [Pyronema omphalodes]|nr:Rec8 like protein-domain-containing protein [Pyronema omphalodes]